MNPFGGGMGFVPVPSWMMEALARERQPEQKEQQVPKRIAVAISMMHHLAQQLSSKVVPSDVGATEFDGRNLEPEEAKVLHTSCHLIVDYLEGKFKETRAEREQKRKQIVKASGTQKSVMRCPQCGGSRTVRGGAKCGLCEGNGALLIEPANPDGNAEEET